VDNEQKITNISSSSSATGKRSVKVSKSKVIKKKMFSCMPGTRILLLLSIGPDLQKDLND